MNNKLVLGLIAILLVVGGYLLLSNTSTSQPLPVQATPTPTPAVLTAAGTIIQVTSSGFSPQTVTIKKGGKVTWVSKIDQKVTVNSDPHPVHTNYPPLNLGSFTKDASVELVFDQPGTYKYHNHLDANMTGTVVVE